MTPEERVSAMREAAYGFSQGESPLENALAAALHHIREAENEALERAAELVQDGTGESSFISCNWAANAVRSLKHTQK